MGVFENIFNFKNKKKDEHEVKNVTDDLENMIVRVAIECMDENTYRPLPYACIEDEVDLFKDQNKFDEVKNNISQAFKTLEKDKELENYVILEFAETTVERLFNMESEFALLNVHLKILPEKTMVLDIVELLHDDNIPFEGKFKLLAISYGLKIYNLLNPENRTSETWISSIKDNDMHITPTGAVEKYVFDLFKKYKVVMYKISGE